MDTTWTKEISAPREKVWSALTAPGMLQPFYFNSLFDAELHPGGKMRYLTPDGSRVLIVGKILDIEPGQKMVQEFRFSDLNEPPQIVTFQLESAAAGTRVTIQHEGLALAPKHASRVKSGWNSILTNLKTLLEQGCLPATTRAQHVVMNFFLKLFAPKV